MKDASVNFFWLGVSCPCRCRHCLLNSGGPVSTVAYENARGVVERFLHWRDAQEANDLTISFGVGYSCDFPQLVEHIKFCARSGIQETDSLEAGGWRKRPQKELGEFLPVLKKAGVGKLGLSFHGIGKSHDDFAGRNEDFGFLLDIAQTAADCGMQRFETMFWRKEITGALPALLHELERIPGCCNRSLCLFDYRGRGKLLEEVRPTLSDIEALPNQLLQFVNRKRFKTEREWVQRIATGTIPEKKYRHYNIPIWGENIGELETSAPNEILLRLRQMDDRLTERLPSLADLSGAFADPDGDRLYALRDLEWKWQDMYLDQCPEIDASGKFDDLLACVLKK